MNQDTICWTDSFFKLAQISLAIFEDYLFKVITI